MNAVFYSVDEAKPPLDRDVLLWDGRGWFIAHWDDGEYGGWRVGTAADCAADVETDEVIAVYFAEEPRYWAPMPGRPE